MLGARLDGYILASESCALTNLGAEVIREIEPGEMVIIEQGGVRFRRYAEEKREAFAPLSTSILPVRTSQSSGTETSTRCASASALPSGMRRLWMQIL